MTVKQGAASLTLGAIGISLLLGLSASAAWGQTAKDLNVVDGNVYIEGNSAADFRGVAFTGEIEVGGSSHASFANSSAVTGNIDIVSGSLVQASGLSVTGAITCSSQSGLGAGTLTATGGTGTCNLAP